MNNNNNKTNKTEADCGSDHELLNAKFRLKLKEVGKTTRPFRCDINHIPYSGISEVAQSCPTLCDLMDCAWNSPGQNTGEDSLSLLEGIFPTQGSNLSLPHCRQLLYCLSHQGSPIQIATLPQFLLCLKNLALFVKSSPNFLTVAFKSSKGASSQFSTLFFTIFHSFYHVTLLEFSNKLLYHMSIWAVSLSHPIAFYFF